MPLREPPIERWEYGRDRLTIRTVRCVAAARQLRPREIYSRARWADLVEARAEVMRHLHAAGFSLPKIGRELGGMHHTTVMHHLQKTPAVLQVAAMLHGPINPEAHDEWI